MINRLNFYIRIATQEESLNKEKQRLIQDKTPEKGSLILRLKCPL